MYREAVAQGMLDEDALASRTAVGLPCNPVTEHNRAGGARGRRRVAIWLYRTRRSCVSSGPRRATDSSSDRSCKRHAGPRYGQDAASTRGGGTLDGCGLILAVLGLLLGHEARGDELSDRSGSTGATRLGALGPASVVLVCAVIGMGFFAGQAVGSAEAPPGLPGPPPSAGSGFPLPPPPGQAPGVEPAGPPTSIPAEVAGPGLLNGIVTVRGTGVALQIACRAGGRVVLSAPTVANGTLAQARYRCSRSRAVVHLWLQSAAARQIARMGQALAAVRFVQAGMTELLSVTLAVRPQAASYWTSDFGLRCDSANYQAQLLAPNFSDTLPTTIDVRPWLAWYTAATGWQWLGTAGVNASRWDRWTATPSGVAEWQTPGGGVTPWTWSPISVTAGDGIYVIAVFEAIYWYSRPEYVWGYARSGGGGDAITTYCAYA